MRVLAIVPAYNEELSVSAVVADLRSSEIEMDVLVVDDGSTDDTVQVATDAGAIVASLPMNMGIGVAVQTGFLYASRYGYDIAFQFDGDGQHVGDEVRCLLEPIMEKSSDVVIGSRFLDVVSYSPPLARRIGIALLRGPINLVCRTRLTDVTSGFRAYNRAAIDFLARWYPSQFPEPEAIVWLSRHGFGIREVPVMMRERRHGRSSIRALKSIWYMLRVDLGVLVTALRGRMTGGPE